MVETITKAVGGLLEAVKNQPLVVALLALNIVYMAGGMLIFREERTRTATVIAQLLDRCTQR